MQVAAIYVLQSSVNAQDDHITWFIINKEIARAADLR